ncbi:MAG: adenylate kinase [Eubacteriaceae bacterium]|nr:adenylate kinase [Eubacteriaceae bacterium]
MKLIILGPAGAGKGTQSEFIVDAYSIAHISTGDIFRKNLKEGTPLGLKAKEYMDGGLLVPDALTVEMLISRISESDCQNGYLLDGFPRSLAQADALEAAGEAIDQVLLIDVDYSLLTERIVGRRVCPECGAAFHISNNPPKIEGICDKCGAELVHRPDDKEETIKARLVEYDEKTKPLIGYYEEKSLLAKVGGDKPIAQVSQAIKQILDSL